MKRYIIVFNGIAIETSQNECQQLYKKALKRQCEISYKKEEKLEMWEFYLNNMKVTIGIFSK